MASTCWHAIICKHLPTDANSMDRAMKPGGVVLALGTSVFRGSGMLTEFDRGFAAGVAATRTLLVTEEPMIHFGPLAHSRQNQRTTYHGRELKMTATYSKLIELLMNGRLVTPERAIATLWPMGETSIDAPKLIQVHIHKLRRLLVEQEVPQAIMTVWGQGYRLDLRTLTEGVQ